MTLKFLIEKEFKQFFRDPALPRLAIVFPVMMMLIMPLVATMDVKEINITVVDNDRSTLSERFVRKIGSSSYFRMQRVSGTYDQALGDVEYGTADVVLEIPDGFESDLRSIGNTSIQISANTVNGTKGSLGSSYLGSMAVEFSQEALSEKGVVRQAGDTPVPMINVSVQNRYNEYLDYRQYMIPALMVMLVIMLCGFMPALNIVGEKEKGTIEQINVTPVGKFTFIMAKLIPYWLLGLTVLTVSMGIAYLFYGLAPAGSLWAIYACAGLFILTMSGFGLIVSNYSSTMQQAMFVMFFFVIIFQLMSGLFTPIKSMPEWAQWVAEFNPPKYFNIMMRQIYLKGSGITDLIPELMALTGFVLFFNGWAVLSYRKNS